MNKQEIVTQIESLFSGTDARDWHMVEATFSEKVLLDYSSMTGLPAAVLTREEITRQRSAFLPRFERTNHQLGGFQVEFGENSAIDFISLKAKFSGLGCDAWKLGERPSLYGAGNLYGAIAIN